MENTNKKKTAILPIKAASIKFLTSEEYFEEAKKIPFMRKPAIESFTGNVLESGEGLWARISTVWLILAVTIEWIGALSNNEQILLAGLYFGTPLVILWFLKLGIHLKDKDEKYLFPIFSKLPGNQKTVYFINELEKLEH